MSDNEQAPRLLKMQITNLIKFADKFVGIEVHLPVNGKFVKLNYPEDLFIDILRKLQQKNVVEVYISEADCKLVLGYVTKSMGSQTFYDPKTQAEKRVEAVNAAMEVVKTVINELGIDAETVSLLKTINMRAMTLLSEAPTIFAFIKQFRNNCSEQFMLSILTNYIMSLVIDQFPWKSDQVKEKGTLASLMCDMTLNKEDFGQIKQWQKGAEGLSDKVRKHPIEIAEALKKNRILIPIETITIIEQHHELPNGKGFPHGISGSRFNQLSAIFIVSQQFTEKLYESDFDFEKRLEIVSDLRSKYGSTKLFNKALEALSEVVT